jgi:hypothetical protein
MRDLSYILAARESTYATAPAMTGPANTQEIWDYNPEPAIYDEQHRRAQRIVPGARSSVMVHGRQRHPFKFDLRGSGTDTVAPRWTAFLGAAMYGDPVPDTDHVDYPLLSTAEGDSLALIGQKDRVKMTPTGVRGNIRFVFEEGREPYGDADFMGLLPALPVGAAPVAPVFPSEPDAEPVTSENTTIQIDGYSVLLRSLTIDLGMKTAYRSLVGSERITFTSDNTGDRRQVGGRIVAELPDPSVKSFFEKVAAQQTMGFSVVHGSGAGRIISFASGQLRMKPISFSEEQGEIMMTADLSFVPVLANNDITLTTS